jgi:hypothetical protein
MSTSATTPAPETPQEIGSLGRIAGAIFSPKPTFRSIVRRPDWLLPIVLGCLVFMAVVGSFTYRGGWASFLEKQDEDSSRVQEMTPEARQSLLDRQVRFAPKLGYAEGVFLPFLSALVVAGIFLGTFTITGGVKTDFKTSLAIVAYAGMPWIIHGLLSVVIIFLKDPATVDLQNVLASNAGAFLSGDAPKWLAALLGSIDIFAIWNLILLGVGFSAINPKKLSFGSAFLTVFLVWIFYVLVKVGAIAVIS